MKIALIGYGKMGKEIEKVAVARGHEIVSIIDVDNQDDFNFGKHLNQQMWLLSLLTRWWHMTTI